MSSGPSLNIRSTQENQASVVRAFTNWNLTSPAGKIHEQLLVPYQIRRFIWATAAAWTGSVAAWKFDGFLRFSLKDVIQFELPIQNMSPGNTPYDGIFMGSIFANFGPPAAGVATDPWCQYAMAGAQPPLVFMLGGQANSYVITPCLEVTVRADKAEMFCTNSTTGGTNFLTGFAILSMQ